MRKIIEIVSKEGPVPLCYSCGNCWGTTKEGEVKCMAYPSGRYHDGIPIHETVLVEKRFECDLFEEADDWSEAYEEWLKEHPEVDDVREHRS